MESLKELINTHAQPGKLEWIGTRSARHAPMDVLRSVSVNAGGLEGDHYASGGKRSVTLIQSEHLTVIASLLDRQTIQPELLRRNLVVNSINLIGLKGRKFKIGTALFQTTGICAPCSRMEKALGIGGYTAMRGHGGITATILEAGHIEIGDWVSPA